MTFEERIDLLLKINHMELAGVALGMIMVAYSKDGPLMDDHIDEHILKQTEGARARLI